MTPLEFVLTAITEQKQVFEDAVYAESALKGGLRGGIIREEGRTHFGHLLQPHQTALFCATSHRRCITARHKEANWASTRVAHTWRGISTTCT